MYISLEKGTGAASFYFPGAVAAQKLCGSANPGFFIVTGTTGTLVK
jgi:hypothetical protein